MASTTENHNFDTSDEPNIRFWDILRYLDSLIDEENVEDAEKTLMLLEKILNELDEPETFRSFITTRKEEIREKKEYLEAMTVLNWYEYFQKALEKGQFNQAMSHGALNILERVLNFAKEHRLELEEKGLENLKRAEERFDFEKQRRRVDDWDWSRDIKSLVQTRNFVSAGQILREMNQFCLRARDYFLGGHPLFLQFLEIEDIYQKAVFKYIKDEAPIETPFNSRHYEVSEAYSFPTRERLREISVEDYLKILGSDLLMIHQIMSQWVNSTLEDGYLRSGADRYEMEHPNRKGSLEEKGWDRLYFGIDGWETEHLRGGHRLADKIDFSKRRFAFVFPSRALLENFYYSEDPAIKYSKENEWAIFGKGDSLEDETRKVPLEYALVLLVHEGDRKEFEALCVEKKLNFPRVFFYQGKTAQEGFKQFKTSLQENRSIEGRILNREDVYFGRKKIRLSEQPRIVGNEGALKAIYGIRELDHEREVLRIMDDEFKGEGSVHVEFFDQRTDRLNRAVLNNDLAQAWTLIDQQYGIKTLKNTSDRAIQEKIVSALESSTFNPKKLIEALKEIKLLNDLFIQRVDMPSSLEDHVVTVMDQFEKYFSHIHLPAGFSRGLFRLIPGALHDLGKILAIQCGNRHLQSRYTSIFVGAIKAFFPYSNEELGLALSLLKGDPLGEYLSGAVTLEVSLDMFSEMYHEAEDFSDISMDDFYYLMLIYYQIDSSSYSKGASPQLSKQFPQYLSWSDDLYEFEGGDGNEIKFDEEKSRLKFSPLFEKKLERFERGLEHIKFHQERLKNTSIILQNELKESA